MSAYLQWSSLHLLMKWCTIGISLPNNGWNFTFMFAWWQQVIPNWPILSRMSCQRSGMDFIQAIICCSPLDLLSHLQLTVRTYLYYISVQCAVMNLLPNLCNSVYLIYFLTSNRSAQEVKSVFHSSWWNTHINVEVLSMDMHFWHPVFRHVCSRIYDHPQLGWYNRHVFISVLVWSHRTSLLVNSVIPHPNSAGCPHNTQDGEKEKLIALFIYL